jgi:CRISPR type III-A-associated protein Csm2
LRRDYVDSIPNEIALHLSQAKLTKHQLRDFYKEVKRLDTAVRSGIDFLEVRERLAKLSAHAQARLGRKTIPAEFKVFIDKNIAKVKTAETLRAFASHFESVVAFSEGRLDDKERG